MQAFDKKQRILFYAKICTIFLMVIGGMVICNKITDPYYSWRHFGAYKDKIEKLKDTSGERTVFVGGSSVLMGVNAEHYSKISGKPAINMGLHALKLYDIYLACIEPYIKSGDTIVLAFEYYPYNYKWEDYDDVGLNVAHESGIYYKLVPLKHKGTYIYQQLLRSYAKLYERMYGITVESKLKGEEKGYLRENITEYGDMKKEINEYSDDPAPYRYDLIFNQDAAKSIMTYIERYEEKGAKVYIVFPPIYTEQPIQENYSALEEFRNTMCTYFGDRVLGHPSDWMFNEKSRFWDTGYHLTYQAALEHTEYYYSLISSAE